MTKKLKKRPNQRKNSQKVAIKRRQKQNRPPHKRLLLHPLTVLILLCSAVFVASWTYKAVADTTISSIIYAPPLSEGATITSPADGTVFTEQVPVSIGGTCPDSSYVNLYVNGVFKGVGVCGTDYTFHVQLSLFSGSNIIRAQDFNITDQAGPATPTISVTLLAPSFVNIPSGAGGSELSPSASNDTTGTSSTPLLLTSDFRWQAFSTGTKFSWKMDLEGGTPPYTVEVDWGDGQTSNYKFNTDPVFSISHTYAKPGYYPVKVYSKDSKGNQRMMQLAALISSPGVNTNFFGHPTIASISSTKSGGLTSFFLTSKNWLWIAWPSLIIVALMMFSFWLGEVQDRRVLLAKRKLSRT